MFSERFDLRQPGSEFYPLWNRAIGRYQYLLRQGRPRIDVGILRTDHFVDNLSGLMFLTESGERVPDEDAYGRWWMRNRENHWWQDLGMQDAGWSYEFFDPSLLLRDEVSMGEGVVQPSGPGYQALIVYQEQLDPSAATLLLDWAREGLRVLIVNGARELKLLKDRLYTTHGRAASETPGLDGRDEELASTMSALRALPNVAEIDDPSGTMAALRGLGVVGRAEFIDDNQSVLTYLREEGGLLHLYAYNFLYETGEDTTVEVALAGHGFVHRVDAWSGRVAPHRGVRLDGDRTIVRIDLAPGETALFTVDRSRPAVESAPADRDELARVEDWSIEVESWDAGEPTVITEDRGLGYETRELRPRTAVTALRPSSQELAPWDELPGVGPEVSGVGQYTASFELGQAAAGSTRVLLDLGSTNGGLGSVVLNGAQARGFDTSHPVVDITDDVRAGRNEVTVRVSSSLNNRLIARGYYTRFNDIALEIHDRDELHVTKVRPYGLVGPVRVLAVSG
jgi:hypothetical protein